MFLREICTLGVGIIIIIIISIARRPGTSGQLTYKLKEEIVLATLPCEMPKKLSSIQKRDADSVPEELSQKKSK